MTSKLVPTISIASIVLLQACGTVQTRNISPYFDGILKLNDEPVHNATILLSITADDSLCRHSIKSTKTNENGQFNLTPAKKQQGYIPFLNYELDTWTVCAEYNSQKYTLHTDNRYEGGNLSASYVLNCDLTKNPVHKLCSVSR